jgi:hypothetical protein
MGILDRNTEHGLRFTGSAVLGSAFWFWVVQRVELPAARSAFGRQIEFSTLEP